MRVIGYARVSSREQAEHGYSIGEQVDRIKAYCTAKDWQLLRVVTDPGFSGANTERPGLQEVLGIVRRRECDAVLVWKLDRLSRSQKDTLALLEDEMLANGCAFVSMLENFDTSTAFGRAMVGILSVFAQLEREQIKERMAIGRVGRAKAGLFHGGGYAPIGYDYHTKADGGAGLVVNEYEALQVREVYRLYLEGWPIHRIQVYMHEHYTNKGGSWVSDSAIRSTLTSPIYIGRITWAGVTYEGQHAAIVSEDEFNRVAARMAALKWQPLEPRAEGTVKQNAPFKPTHVLGGLMWCAWCGARYFATGNYSGHAPNKKYWPYYVCYSRAKSNKSMMRAPNCKNDRWPVARLEGLIFDEIKMLEFDADALRRVVAPAESGGEDVEQRRAVLEGRVADIRSQVERLLDLCQVGGLSVSTVSGRVVALQEEDRRLSAELASLAAVPAVSDVQAAADMLNGVSAALESGTPEQKRDIVHSLISRIELDGQNITIHWTFSPQA